MYLQDYLITRLITFYFLPAVLISPPPLPLHSIIVFLLFSPSYSCLLLTFLSPSLLLNISHSLVTSHYRVTLIICVSSLILIPLSPSLLLCSASLVVFPVYFILPCYSSVSFPFLSSLPSPLCFSPLLFHPLSLSPVSPSPSASPCTPRPLPSLC